MSQHEIHPVFTDFARDEYPRVGRFLLRKGASVQTAEDICQITMLEMYRRWEQFPDLQRRRAYMYTVARNALYKDWIKTNKRGEQELSPDMQLADPQQDTASLALANGVESQVVLHTLQSLPERQRTIMALTTDGHRPEEIAEILNLTPVAVRSSLRHARNKLKTALQEGKDHAREGEEREGLHRQPAG